MFHSLLRLGLIFGTFALPVAHAALLTNTGIDAYQFTSIFSTAATLTISSDFDFGSNGTDGTVYSRVYQDGLGLDLYAYLYQVEVSSSASSPASGFRVPFVASANLYTNGDLDGDGTNDSSFYITDLNLAPTSGTTPPTGFGDLSKGATVDDASGNVRWYYSDNSGNATLIAGTTGTTSYTVGVISRLPPGQVPTEISDSGPTLPITVWAVVPEPLSLLLVGSAIGGLIVTRRRSEA